MGTDPVLTAMEFQRCFKVDQEKTPAHIGFVSYDLHTDEVYLLEEKFIQATRRIKGDCGDTYLILLLAVRLFVREGVERPLLEAMRRRYDQHWGQQKGSGKPGGRRSEGGVDLDVTLEKNLQWAETANAVDVIKKALVEPSALITAVGQEVPFSENGCVEPLRCFAAEAQLVHRESEVVACTLAGQAVKVGELELKAQLLANDTGEIFDMRKQ